jgi:hypothetical protein
MDAFIHIFRSLVSAAAWLMATNAMRFLLKDNAAAIGVGGFSIITTFPDSLALSRLGFTQWNKLKSIYSYI